MCTYFISASQPSVGRGENCLTAFIPAKLRTDAYIPKWFDRPCVEIDGGWATEFYIFQIFLHI